ncbi:DUF4230 domain-containing protein [Herpetosiphon giganteus]|uniref:DUF4230 domain-containing protein n=1 Tax=Herpetosiphon giganteus TaxID=2029754 RepID=UPI001956690B|nr:DUF4230 domain-containing protein [Herpetosiphon giganteus]MBM7845985.1 hypothetical protein [Herpetosiphon giganteus]
MYRQRNSGCISSLFFLLIGALGIMVVLSITGLFDPIGMWFSKPQTVNNAQGPAIVQQLRARNEWITFSYQADQVIEARNEGNFFQELLYGDRILLQARGEVGLGIDMSELRDDQIVIDGKSINITLPPTRIIYSRLDNQATRVYDREQGWLSRGDVNLESNARSFAEQSIIQSACENGVLDRAAIEAQKNVSDLLYSLDYTNVTVNVSKVGDCAGSANQTAPQQPNVMEPTAPASVPTNSTAQPSVAPQPNLAPTPTSSGGSLSGTAVPINP